MSNAEVEQPPIEQDDKNAACEEDNDCGLGSMLEFERLYWQHNPNYGHKQDMFQAIVKEWGRKPAFGKNQRLCVNLNHPYRLVTGKSQLPGFITISGRSKTQY